MRKNSRSLSDKTIAAIHDLWVQGWSGLEIARQLSTPEKPMTRNSVIGLVNRRRKLKGGEKKWHRLTAQERTPKGHPYFNSEKRMKKRKPDFSIKGKAELSPATPLRPPEPLSNPVSWETRKMGRQCAWIEDDPLATTNLQCCGSPVVQGFEWCEHHKAVVYIPEDVRRKRMSRTLGTPKLTVGA